MSKQPKFHIYQDHEADCWRKMKTPTPCPDRWANVYPERICSWYSGRREAEAGADLGTIPGRIGVLHLSPNGDCEFIRTEEL